MNKVALFYEAEQLPETVPPQKGTGKPFDWHETSFLPFGGIAEGGYRRGEPARRGACA
jgi:hypothetical protein